MLALTEITAEYVLPDPTDTGVLQRSNPRRIVLVPDLLNDVNHPHNKRIIERAADLVYNIQAVSA